MRQCISQAYLISPVTLLFWRNTDGTLQTILFEDSVLGVLMRGAVHNAATRRAMLSVFCMLIGSQSMYSIYHNTAVTTLVTSLNAKSAFCWRLCPDDRDCPARGWSQQAGNWLVAYKFTFRHTFNCLTKQEVHFCVIHVIDFWFYTCSLSAITKCGAVLAVFISRPTPRLLSFALCLEYGIYLSAWIHLNGKENVFYMATCTYTYTARIYTVSDISCRRFMHYKRKTRSQAVAWDSRPYFLTADYLGHSN